jgi:hypothetical protein
MEEEYEENERKINEEIERYIRGGYKREIKDIEEIREGEIIIVRYIPYSQRDLYIHKSEMGEYIGENKMKNIEGKEVNIMKEGLYNDQKSYYSEGYCMIIERIYKD